MTAAKAAYWADKGILLQQHLLQYNNAIGDPYISRMHPIFPSVQAFIMHCLILVNCAKHARAHAHLKPNFAHRP
jgi:hypothetical protein